MIIYSLTDQWLKVVVACLLHKFLSKKQTKKQTIPVFFSECNLLSLYKEVEINGHERKTRARLAAFSVSTRNSVHKTHTTVKGPTNFSSHCCDSYPV